MKTRSCCFGCVAGWALVVAMAASVQGETAVYDFESNAMGVITGQTGPAGENAWAKYASGAYDLTVTTGMDVNTTKVATFADVGGFSGESTAFAATKRPTFASGTTAEQHVWVYMGSVAGSDQMYGGLTWAGQSPANEFLNWFGIESGEFYVRTKESGSPEYRGNSATAQHWYDLKLTMDFSTQGGLGSLSYRDVTLGQTAYTAAGIEVQNLPLNIAAVSGKYVAQGFQVFGYNESGTNCIDNMSVSWGTVPEPSTLTLAAMGAMSVLVYAWKKRRQ